MYLAQLFNIFILFSILF